MESPYKQDYWIENIVAIGEISHDDQFFLLSKNFQALLAADATERVYRVKSCDHINSYITEIRESKDRRNTWN